MGKEHNYNFGKFSPQGGNGPLAKWLVKSEFLLDLIIGNQTGVHIMVAYRRWSLKESPLYFD